MKLSRRRAVLRLSRACLAVMALPARSLAAPADPLVTISRSDWTQYLRTSFTANAGSLAPTWLTLVAVDEVKTPNEVMTKDGLKSVPRTEAFNLRFLAVGNPLKEDTYDFEHPALGRVKLFVSPGPNDTYAAAVNRLLDPVPPVTTEQKKANPAK